MRQYKSISLWLLFVLPHHYRFTINHILLYCLMYFHCVLENLMPLAVLGQAMAFLISILKQTNSTPWFIQLVSVNGLFNTNKWLIDWLIDWNSYKSCKQPNLLLIGWILRAFLCVFFQVDSFCLRIFKQIYYFINNFIKIDRYILYCSP